MLEPLGEAFTRIAAEHPDRPAVTELRRLRRSLTLLYTAGSAAYPQLVDLLAEMIPLAARRGGGLTWEYYFKFDGGLPPWTSAMSQGTALQALADAYKEIGDRSYLVVAHSALPVFSRPPSSGVGVKTDLGMRYVEYSFDSSQHDEVINAFLQTLIGLDD